MQARGHIVVLLAGDRHRREAEQQCLERYRAAKPFGGTLDIVEPYAELTRFHKFFLSELGSNANKSYEVRSLRLLPGKLTEDIPVFVREYGKDRGVDILVDVKHPEIAKLESPGYTPILHSLVSTFCHEYLGPPLKKRNPRFFRNGALNLDLLSKRRSELWVLVRDGVGVVRKGGQKQVVTRSNDHVVNVRPGQVTVVQPDPVKSKPRILRDDCTRTGCSFSEGRKNREHSGQSRGSVCCPSTIAM
jgi:hypothetical protein